MRQHQDKVYKYIYKCLLLSVKPDHFFLCKEANYRETATKSNLLYLILAVSRTGPIKLWKTDFIQQADS